MTLYKRVLYEGDNPDGYMIQQLAGLRFEGRCGVTTPCCRITGKHGVGVARPAHRVGGIIHALTQAKRGELQYVLEGVRGGARVRGSNSEDEVLMVGLVMVLKVLINHIGLDDEDTLGYSVGTFDSITYEKNLWVHCQKIL